MILKVLACKVLFREICLLCAKSKNFIDLTCLKQGLHDEPQFLKEKLQAEIDRIDSGEDLYTCNKPLNKDYDAILLGYGLCSNGIIGLSSKKYTLVVPKAHDCITLFLGSREKYSEYFNSHKGVYWYNPGWIENTPMPGKERYETLRNDYIERYGEDNADYLMEMEQGWFKEYNWCTFIDWPDFDNSLYKDYTRQCAEFLNWNYDEVQGNKSLLSDFLDGKWDTERFLVVPPGKTIEPSFDDNILCVK